MLKFTEVLTSVAGDRPEHSTRLTLSYERRIISRQRVILDDGRDARLFLPRGTVLQDGEYLRAESGEVVRINAAEESVSTVYCAEHLLLARACYHLGNRHVPLQIDHEVIRYQHDHVLDAMLQGLGMTVTVEQAVFTPEAGAYGGGHTHHHAHNDEDHDHCH